MLKQATTLVLRISSTMIAKLRWNGRAQVAEWSSPPPWAREPRPITDADSVEAAKWIGETRGVEGSCSSSGRGSSMSCLR